MLGGRALFLVQQPHSPLQSALNKKGQKGGGQ
jgi:hypothetical protein